jgi:hypothetical protein
MTRGILDENVYGFPLGVVWRLDGENRTKSVRQGSCTTTPKHAIVRYSMARFLRQNVSNMFAYVDHLERG